MIGVTIQYILWTVDCLQAIHFSYESYYVTTEMHALFPYVAMNEGAGRESSLRQPHRRRRRGNTEFTSLYLAYEALPDETRETIRGRRPFHAYLWRRAPRKLLTRTKDEEKSSSGCWQPLVRLHPDTGRKSLYLNPMRCDAVEDMDRKDGDTLLDRLYGRCDQARFQYSHRRRPGDVLIRDNRCALHQATFDFDQSRRRYLHRIMLRGERPVPAP